MNPNFWIKIKGKKHSVTNDDKVLSPVPPEMKTAPAFVNYVLTQQRLEQGLSEKHSNVEEYLNWLVQDIFKEENDILKGGKKVRKMVIKEVKSRGREYFLKNYKK